LGHDIDVPTHLPFGVRGLEVHPEADTSFPILILFADETRKIVRGNAIKFFNLDIE